MHGNADPGNCAALIAALLLSGCAASAISPAARDPELPAHWSSVQDYQPVEEGWLAAFGDRVLNELVATALDNNHQLRQRAADLEASRQAAIASGAPLLPELSLAFTASRRRSISNEFGIERKSSNFELGLDLNWEADVWGKLRDTRKQAVLTMLSEQARYEDTRLRLAAQVAKDWFNVVAASDRLALLRERLANLDKELDIIERGYNQGVRDALDVYLARAGVEQERARVIAQEQLLRERRVALQLRLADYPDSGLAVNRTLPVLDTPIPVGLPSELIGRRPDLQQLWNGLLARDAGVAIAHKQRFPRIALVASGNDVSRELDRLLDGSSLAWSVLGNLAQPLFNRGRLRAQEERARSRVVAAERAYLFLLNQAFSEVENAISRNQSLQARYRTTLAAEQNAVTGLALAFAQYQRGLTPYVTVLEAQRRAFDIQSRVIDLRNQLLQNRIDLYQALGGGFTP